MTARYIMAIDQGTTSSRVVLVDRDGAPAGSASEELRQIYPNAGWVEHDPAEIWSAVQRLAERAVEKAGGAGEIGAIGITNQRETTVLWDRASGEPVYNAIVWQDRRTADLCRVLHGEGLGDDVQRRTGLLIDPYFSATKLAWLLENVDGARERAGRGELCFGTIDCWLVWKLTAGASHRTDVSNAARTMLFDIHQLAWDQALLDRLDIPVEVLPEVVPSQADFGVSDPAVIGAELPILGVAGDQQAATFGQACFAPGMIKSTYGTGCFMLANSGATAVRSDNRLLTTVAWQRGAETVYAVEGSIFMAGATIQWLRDSLGLFDKAEDTERLAAEADGDSGVYMVPAFVGLGAPYWDPVARAAITGLSRGAGRAEVVRAGLESVAYQSRDLIEAVSADMAGQGLERPGRIRVDGGMVANDWFVQCLADQLGIPVERTRHTESTALGAAYLAGLEAGIYTSLDDLAGQWQSDRVFEPEISADLRESRYQGWQEAVQRVL
ncbi:MAG: glycerol kinase GlpK [Hyphomicrobiales bacterium]